MEKFQVGEEAIIVEHGKVIDMITGNRYAGCMCTTQDRNRYDKESNTIICSEYGTCLKSIYKKWMKIKNCN